MAKKIAKLFGMLVLMGFMIFANTSKDAYTMGTTNVIGLSYELITLLLCA